MPDPIQGGSAPLPLSPRPTTLPVAPGKAAAAAPEGDTVHVSIDARAQVRDGHAELMAYEVHTDGTHLDAAAHQVAGLRKGVRDQVIQQIATKVADALAPQVEGAIEKALKEAMTGQELTADQAAELAHQLAPKITADITKILVQELGHEVAAALH